MKTSYQICLEFVILCSNRWLKLEVTAQQKSVFPRCRPTNGVYPAPEKTGWIVSASVEPLTGAGPLTSTGPLTGTGTFSGIGPFSGTGPFSVSHLYKDLTSVCR